MRSSTEVGGVSCGAVLDGEGQVVALAAEVEMGVAPGVKLGGAAQRLAGVDAAPALLGVVDHGDRGRGGVEQAGP